MTENVIAEHLEQERTLPVKTPQNYLPAFPVYSARYNPVHCPSTTAYKQRAMESGFQQWWDVRSIPNNNHKAGSSRSSFLLWTG